MKHGNERKDRFPIFRERLNILLGDMSTTDFADKVDVSRQTMGFYLNGERIPDSLTLARICRECNVTADWLLGLTNDPNPEPCATDELGLSNRAIEAVTGYTKEQKDGLTQLLENELFKLVCSGISQYAKVPDSDKFDFDSCDNPSRYFDFESKAHKLEELLTSSDNELAGKVKVLVGYHLSDYFKRDIVDSFERVIYSFQFDKEKTADR